MFLTAVLQAHTDSLPPAANDEVSPRIEETAVALPEQLEKALAVPLQERLQPLPSVHRSRWI
jgi:hypothetical protein